MLCKLSSPFLFVHSPHHSLYFCASVSLSYSLQTLLPSFALQLLSPLNGRNSSKSHGTAIGQHPGELYQLHSGCVCVHLCTCTCVCISPPVFEYTFCACCAFKCNLPSVGNVQDGGGNRTEKKRASREVQKNMRINQLYNEGE